LLVSRLAFCSAIVYNGDPSIPKTGPIYWGEPGTSFRICASCFCALRTAGENDNSEIGYLNEE